MSSFTALRSVLESKKTAYGFWLTLPSAGGARTILRSGASVAGGFKWVLVDGEHGLIGEKDYYELCNAIAAEGASPIIRVPWNEEWMIKRALDSGAHGVLTPMCHNAEDAAKIVRYSKYPPTGSRGYGPSYAVHALPGGGEYDSKADDGLVVAVQIESTSGVENVEEIAKVPGLDILLIGPFDLAKQMNVVRGGEEHEAAILKTLNAAHAAGKTAAIYCTDGADAKRRADQGFDMVSIISDQSALGLAMAYELERSSGKDAAERGAGKGY
ncbi:Phosphoenolpyruvate/pyruvate domain-containing protein [Xylariaceae sp. FL0255]|nr:Phosphoenolpyruvate/pyruvate domain-containing protein [Xylariaceae sp. FL0255]